MARGRLILLAALFFAVVFSAGGWLLLRDRKLPRQVAVAGTPPLPSSPGPVLTGRVRPQRMVNVTAPVAGTVSRVLVEVGQDGYAGQLLAELSNGKLAVAQALAKQDAEKANGRERDLASELRAAQVESSKATVASIRAHAALTTAEKEFVRQQVLDREGATPHLAFLRAQDDYQAALANVESLDALAQQARERVPALSRELDAARGDLQDRTGDFAAITTVSEIHAPVDGVIVAQLGKPGEAVNAGQTSLFQIAVNLSLLDVVVGADAKTLAGVRPGAPAIVRIAEAGDVEIPATVREVGPEGMVIGFDSPSPAIKPGMTALVWLAARPQR